jgi:HlyD family secretion protein
VLRLYEDSERVVAAGAPILELGRPEDLELVAEVLSTDAVAIAPGAPMSAEVGGGRRLLAHVREVEPAGFTKISPLGVEEQRVRVIGVPDTLTPEVGDRYRIRARIVLWRGEEVLQAPPGAIFRADDGWAAFRLVDGRAVRTPVEVGHRGSDGVEILAGLEPGAEVLLYPGERIDDRVRVRPVDAR